MKLWMTEAEERAFRNFLAPVTNYLEFGCGGSTVAAAGAITGRLVSVDSSAEWLDKVRDALATVAVRADVALRRVDIGPVKDAGFPEDESRKADWHRYHSEIWESERPDSFDMVLIDGRFRVPCFLQAVLRCRPDTMILLHDYAVRPGYRLVESVAREVFREENLSAFVRRLDFERAAALDLLERCRDAPG